MRLGRAIQIEFRTRPADRLPWTNLWNWGKLIAFSAARYPKYQCLPEGNTKNWPIYCRFQPKSMCIFATGIAIFYSIKHIMDYKQKWFKSHILALCPWNDMFFFEAWAWYVILKKTPYEAYQSFSFVKKKTHHPVL